MSQIVSRGAAHAMPSAGGRLLSLDVMRGVVVAAMILVTDPGTYSARYAVLAHADWEGGTPTDMIFPAFLVMVGIALTFSAGARLERGESRGSIVLNALRRAALLIILGLLLNAFPTFDWHHLRVPGILQRIAICYLAAVLIYLPLRGATAKTGPNEAGMGESQHSRRILMGVTLILCALLAAYWSLLTRYPVPVYGAGHLDMWRSVASHVDLKVFGARHMWAYGLTPGRGVTYDSEGLPSTLGALATLLVGVAAGEWLRTPGGRTRKAVTFGVAGLLLVVAGAGLEHWMPSIKKLWTPSFALWSAGVCLIVFGLLFYAIDVRRWHRGLTPALVLGSNAIAAFALSTVLTTVLSAIRVPLQGGIHGLYEWIDHYVFATWLPPKLASLMYALMIVALNVALVYPLYRKRWFLRL